jgi:hypothetical protein
MKAEDFMARFLKEEVEQGREGERTAREEDCQVAVGACNHGRTRNFNGWESILCRLKDHQADASNGRGTSFLFSPVSGRRWPWQPLAISVHGL